MGWVSAFQRFPCGGEAGLLGNTLQIRVHLCSSVVELLFLGLAAASMQKNLRFAPFLRSRLRDNLLTR